MVTKETVLDAAIGLILERGTVPSIAEVARTVGLSKQGVLHYFPSRSALDEAVLLRALVRVDTAMQAAAQNGRAAETYLRLAAPSQEDRAAALVVMAMLRQGNRSSPSTVEQAIDRWHSMMSEELGDPLRARVVRLVGDGLFSQALVTGAPPPPELVDELVAHLITDEHRPRS